MRRTQFFMGLIAGSIVGAATAATTMTMMPQIQRRAQKMIKQGKKALAQNNMFDLN